MMPLDLTMTIPTAYFFALIKLILDLQANSELDAMYAGGRSIINILSPIFWVGVLLTLVMFWLTMELSIGIGAFSIGFIFLCASH